MWFNQRNGRPDWERGRKYLAKKDPVLKHVMRCVGPCTLAPRRDYFVVLCKSIFTQQISTKVAAVLFARFRKLFPRGTPTAKGVLALSDQALRGVGLSRQKITYLRDLSTRFDAGEIPTRRFGSMTDEEIIQSLLPIKGVGRWTAEMFLIFVLNRPDVWPVDDFGVRKFTQEAYGMKEMPKGKPLVEFGEKWRPWRTLATWYLWRWGGLTPELRGQPPRDPEQV